MGRLIEAAFLAGLSGITANIASLVGVFLENTLSPSSTPAPLSFGTNPDFQVLYPELGQMFFIGDGRNGDGGVRNYYMPAGATDLYLGVLDTCFSPAAGGYFDNLGSWTLQYLSI